MQKLVEVFPKICQGDVPLAGTDAATRRISNLRLHHLGRRSMACRLPPGYVSVQGPFGCHFSVFVYYAARSAILL